MSALDELWRIYRDKLPLLRTDSKEHRFIAIVAFICALLSIPTNGQTFLATLQGTTQTLATIWGGILGLITAGLAIFLQALNPDYLVRLYEIREEKTNLRHLEYRLICYIEAFWYLLWGMLFFLSIYAVTLTGFSSYLLPLPRISTFTIKFCLLWIVGVNIGTGAYQLMSLGYNLYSSTITQAAALKILMDKAKKEKKQ